MVQEKLKDNIYWVGVKDPDLKVFDIIMETKKGTTYNSYVINDEKVALVDTVKTGYYDEFKEISSEAISEESEENDSQPFADSDESKEEVLTEQVKEVENDTEASVSAESDSTEDNSQDESAE